MAKGQRSAAQRAATRRLVALNRARAKGKMHSNPARRKTHHKTHRKTHATRRRYHHNPSLRGMGKGIMGNLLMPSLEGVAGSLALDLVAGYIPLPVAIKASPARHLVKGAGAVLIGMLSKSRFAQNAARGAMTVALDSAAKDLLAVAAPNLKLGAEPTSEELAGMGFYVENVGLPYTGGVALPEATFNPPGSALSGLEGTYQYAAY